MPKMQDKAQIMSYLTELSIKIRLTEIFEMWLVDTKTSPLFSKWKIVRDIGSLCVFKRQVKTYHLD